MPAPRPTPGFWNDPNRTDVPIGSTGDAGLDALNLTMPKGTEMGMMNLGGGFYGTPGKTGQIMGRFGQGDFAQAQPAPLPGGVQRRAVPTAARQGRRAALRKRLMGMMGGGGA